MAAAVSRWPNGCIGTFQAAHPFDARKAEASRMRTKFPTCVPIIVERSSARSGVPTIDKNKFLVPGDLTVGQFMHVLRKRMTLKPEVALFVFVDDTLPSSSALMSEVYKFHKSDDDFLYVVYTGEATFGKCCASGAPPLTS